ncbi:Oidioi.mRNA.OKI2018_I69.PAR.g9922.t1.cds [Oikopleura dioica]|uniref:Oidioi.mRNA.OKI2018_I69.PAR.g9922.t1.cds n=1 Tax=Oikopleura dioica TaxID=34765 RepID=A0ABN7RMX8_OIKDI|nr:Oidioi.mRNA.OKI2018_I69.PAR.g9922.t1.cds [Oikopleura dioica]
MADFPSSSLLSRESSPSDLQGHACLISTQTLYETGVYPVNQDSETTSRDDSLNLEGENDRQPVDKDGQERVPVRKNYENAAANYPFLTAEFYRKHCRRISGGNGCVSEGSMNRRLNEMSENRFSTEINKSLESFRRRFKRSLILGSSCSVSESLSRLSDFDDIPESM